MQEIRKITKKTNSFISFYDNDKAGKEANKQL
jgi:DNA primase